MKLLLVTLGSLLVAGGCGLGLDQDFDLAPGSSVSDGENDMLFELTNRGGNSSEPLDVYRVTLDDVPLGGGLFARNDHGDGVLELVSDGGEAGFVDPGDVVRVYESEDGMNLKAADDGRTLWINVMVLDLGQRSSDALTRSWVTVWSSEWRVGG